MATVRRYRWALWLLAATAVVFLIWPDGHLRGSIEDSPDGKTYLKIGDDHGGRCRPILIDDKPWPHAQGAAHEIEPGIHSIIGCGRIGFEVPAGKVYSFDYWGP